MAVVFITQDGKTITGDQFDEMAGKLGSGQWSWNGEVTSGRPGLFDEDLEAVRCVEEEPGSLKGGAR